MQASLVIQKTSMGKQRTIKFSKWPINEVYNLMNILLKLLRNTFYGFNWLNMTLSGRNYPIWPRAEALAVQNDP